MFAVLGGFVYLLFLIVASSIFNGYALSVLWGWFVVPTFGVPQLSVVSAIGIALIVSYMTHQITDDKKGEKGNFGETMAQATANAITKPLFALLFGYIVHLFM